MHRIPLSNPIASVPLATGAALLTLISCGVMIIWHIPSLFLCVYPYATLMAYNTTVSFQLCGLALIEIVKHLHQLGIVLDFGLLPLSSICIL